MTVASFILAVLAVLIAGVSMAYTKKQATGQATVAAIERDRRHDELAPVFAVTCVVRETSGESADLRVSLTGGGLDYLDEVVITILDEADRDHWTRGLPEGVSQEKAESFVWGAWEFNTGAGAQVVSNRETRPRSYSRTNGKNWDVLSLNPTRPGHWMTGTSQKNWQRQYRDHPIRLLITCRRQGYEPWLVQCDVHVDYPKVARIRTLDA